LPAKLQQEIHPCRIDALQPTHIPATRFSQPEQQLHPKHIEPATTKQKLPR